MKIVISAHAGGEDVRAVLGIAQLIETANGSECELNLTLEKTHGCYGEAFADLVDNLQEKSAGCPAPTD